MMNTNRTHGASWALGSAARTARRFVERHRANARASYNRRRMRVRGGFHNGTEIAPYQGVERGNEVVKRLLEDSGPVMVARYGDVELKMISSMLSGASREELLTNMKNLHINAGFFPPRIELLPQFIEVYENAAREID